MTEEIKSRIAKLLALARNNSNEHEADAALRRAAKMMAEHGIKESDVTGSKIVLGSIISTNKMWKRTLATAASELYGTDLCFNYDFSQVQFTGKPESNEASMETFKWMVEQVEFLYKSYLPRGLSVSDRAHHRSRFKDACANRIFVRVVVIMGSLKQENIPGTSLVVLTQVKQDQAAASDFLTNEMGLEESKRHKTVATVDRTSVSSYMGIKAGDSVQLNKVVKS